MRHEGSPSGAGYRPVMTERRVSLLGALFVVVGPVSMALYTPAMTEIVQAFGTTESAVKMTLALYFAGFAFAQLVGGPLSDAMGRRPVMMIFMGIYVAASLLALSAPGIEVLLAARFLQGIGASAGVAVARAMVRDLFDHEQSSRIMNLIGIMLALGPAIAPTIGGFTMQAAGWHAIFLLMAGLGVIVFCAAVFAMHETVVPDMSRLRPAALASAYLHLVGNAHFMTTALVLAFTTGALYAQATFLPFILMERVGLTPAQFGLSMVLQSGAFFVGALVVRALLARVTAERLVIPGLVMVGLGGLGQLAMHVVEPGLWQVMAPVSLYAIGIAFVMPAVTTICLHPFRHMAGAASAMMGFLQMGMGLAMGSLGALMGDPVFAMATLIPFMGLSACVLFAVYKLRVAIGAEM
ncbi:MAG: multidrug effflux MFS transporter [Zhengella sp.]|uniref:multidrug effflux MFS transporter n=1 Tax=Zhengella sp. TaxID=2282762 RepID=UPI001DCBFD23|nr:multidrug effflux MFS transporter [Notoacmeibacter sp.]